MAEQNLAHKRPQPQPGQVIVVRRSRGQDHYVVLDESSELVEVYKAKMKREGRKDVVDVITAKSSGGKKTDNSEESSGGK